MYDNVFRTAPQLRCHVIHIQGNNQSTIMTAIIKLFISPRLFFVLVFINIFNEHSQSSSSIFCSMHQTEFLKGMSLLYTYIHTLFSSLPSRGFSLSGRLHQVPKLHISLIKLSIFTVFLIIFLTINPHPHCQHSLWEETGEPGENPRLSAEF